MSAAGEVLEGRSVGAVVVDDHQAHVVRFRLTLDPGDRLAEQIDGVARGNHDADGRGPGNRPRHVVHAHPGARVDGAVHPETCEPLGEASGSCHERLGLGKRSPRNGIPVHAPAVQNLTNMPDLAGQLGAAQEKVVVLAAVEALAKASRTVEELAAYRREMTHVVAAFHELRGPVSLEVRPDAAVALIKPVLIRVDKVTRWMRAQMADYLEQRVRTEHVIVVEKRDHRTRGHFDRVL